MHKVYCYFGHHKCASTWIKLFIYDVCSALGLKPVERHSTVIDDINAFIDQNDVDFYISQISNYSKISSLKNFKAFHVIRDPRDIIISAYYSHLYSHSVAGWEELHDFRKELQQLDKREGLMQEISFSKQFIDNIASWNYQHPDILEVKMEKLTEDPLKGFIEIFSFLGIYHESAQGALPVKVSAILNKTLRKLSLPYNFNVKHVDYAFVNHLVSKHAFTRLAGGRNKGTEDPTSHYRKGIAGDWRNHFEPVHKAKFIELYGDLLIRLGYESDNNW